MLYEKGKEGVELIVPSLIISRCNGGREDFVTLCFRITVNYKKEVVKSRVVIKEPRLVLVANGHVVCLYLDYARIVEGIVVVFEVVFIVDHKGVIDLQKI